MGRLRSQLLPLVCAILGAASAPAADPTCKFLADANAKIYTVPAHLYMTETAAYTGGKARSSELIYLNDKTYLQVNGKWRLSPTTQKDMQEAHKEAEAGSAMACHEVRAEPVDGESAVLYSIHQQSPAAKMDSQIWISKSRGLPLRLEMDMDVGGAAGKSHRTMRYEYTNVQAPAGVH